MNPNLNMPPDSAPQLHKLPIRGGWTAFLAIVTLLALAALFLADRLYNPQLFRIQAIEVHGQFSHVDGKQIKEVVEQSLFGNYFSLSLASMERRIAQLPWVFRAAVRRQWPDTLVVDVVEVQPVAKWGKHQWLNFTGDLVAKQPHADDKNLPLLLAPDNQQEAVWQSFKSWSKMFATNGLYLERLRLDPRGLWYLTVTVGTPTTQQNPISTPKPPSVLMVVGQKNATQQIKRFVDTLSHPVLPEFAAMRTIDLRYPNGFAVKWKTVPPTRRLADSP